MSNHGRSMPEEWTNSPDDPYQVGASSLAWVADALHNYPELSAIAYTVEATGSQQNRTNIHASDADIQVIFPDRPANDWQAAERLAYLRDQVQTALQQKVAPGDSVEASDKCLNIDTDPDIAQTDVLPCYRTEIETNGLTVPVIEFWSQTGNHIIHSPWLRTSMTSAKEAATAGAFGNLTRALKHARERLIAQDYIGPDTAPSFYLESTAVSVPNHLYSGDIASDIRTAAAFCQAYLRSKRLRTANGLFTLIGSMQDMQWPQTDAAKFFTALQQSRLE